MTRKHSKQNSSSSSKTKSSKEWLKRHFDDIYVQKSWKSKYRSRAAFKLIEIQEKDKLIKPGMIIVDLGAAPGSWSQVVLDIIKDNGKLIALDILPMDPINNIKIITGDFTDNHVLELLEKELNNKKIDLVISDMAPNLSGNKSVDQAKSIYLNELALDFAINNLKQGGNFLCKSFQGVGYQEFFKNVKKKFGLITSRKPNASRES